jgi:hypothetical protein
MLLIRTIPVHARGDSEDRRGVWVFYACGMTEGQARAEIAAYAETQSKLYGRAVSYEIVSVEEVAGGQDLNCVDAQNNDQLPPRVRSLLRLEGLDPDAPNWAEVAAQGEAYWLTRPNCGKKTVEEIAGLLRARGLRFAPRQSIRRL